MFIDARGITEGAVLNTVVCIAGGGVAGISLALELTRAGIEVVLLESGGFTSDQATNDLYRGDNIGLPYNYDCEYRSRYLGGSSNCWGGWNRPLEPEDFTKRSWVPHSGWPIDQRDLEPYYARTHELLELGPVSFDAEFWGDAIAGPKTRRIPFGHSPVMDAYSQFSPPTRMGSVYRDRMATEPLLRVLLHANVVDIETDGSGRSVRQLDVATLNGNRFQVVAKHFVLAAGGIENARLLLAANRGRPRGLGNDFDQVGRYFMDHPRLQAGSIQLREGWKNNRLYDIKYHKTRLLTAHDTAVATQFVLRPEVIEREQLLHARAWFRSVFLRENSPRVEALYRFAHDDRKSGRVSRLARDALDRLFTSSPFLRGIRFEIIAEPDPNPDSRVTLSRDKDALGMPRACVNWQLGPLVQKTIARTLQILSAELRRVGVADIALPELFPQAAWPADLLGTWHHMGTTRMSESAENGVVDPHCRVHGMGNLYIAGSSVFPTGGGNFPTMTLTALALRLADHLQHVVRREQLHVVPSSTIADSPVEILRDSHG